MMRLSVLWRFGSEIHELWGDVNVDGAWEGSRAHRTRGRSLQVVWLLLGGLHWLTGYGRHGGHQQWLR